MDIFRCHAECCVTVYNDKMLNSVQAWLPGFSAMYHYTKFDMASTIILTGIVGLLAIYPLTGCASLGGAPDTRTTLAVTPIATATATGIAMATAKGQASPWKLF